MKIRCCALFFISLIIFSCQNDENKREAEKLKDLKKKELVFQAIDKSWSFTTRPLNPETQSLVKNWSEWRQFLSELNQKPKSSIGAFQQKSRALSKKVGELNTTIPPKLAQPAVKSRIAVLLTQIRSLDLYIHLDQIPDKKVTALIQEINAAIASLEMQFEEITRKEQIPVEQGESDMIRMLDTSRAIPSTNPPQNFP
ncbi:MAG TPA: hypothetical protein VF677_06615 [Flavobacterium sp.]|jgi:hypothetical protein